MKQEPNGAKEHRVNSECARLETHTEREQSKRLHLPIQYAGALIRESVRVGLLAGLPRARISATLHSIANDISTGRPLRRTY